MDPCHSLRRALLAVALGMLLAPRVDAEPQSRVAARLHADVAVVPAFRPAYPFWQHVFSMTREQYFMGSQFARDLRAVDLRGYRDLYRTYGPRSFRYAEMVFGNTVVVRRIRDEVPQERIFATRAARPIPMGEITSRTHLTAAEVLRFNPALTRQVPPHANLYLPMRVPEFGDDLAFWHQPASAPFTEALDAFLQLDAGAQRWLDASFEPVLQAHRRRFEATGTPRCWPT